MMQIQHRISFNSSKVEILFRLIKKIGIDYDSIDVPGGRSQMVYFDITESDPNWSDVSELIQVYNVVDIYDTFFTKSEILSAAWARLISTHIKGYPQPFDTWVTNPINYMNNCNSCGTFLQASSFHLHKELNLNKKDFLTLNWAENAFFCTSRVFNELDAHQIKGYEKWNVIINETQAPSQKIFQLFVPNVAAPGLIGGDDLVPTNCPQCNIKKYSHHQRGIMQIKQDALNPELDIIRSFEWFGAGRDAYQEVFVSNRLVRIIIGKGWKGVRFKILKLVE